MASLNLELLKQANAQAAKYAADDDDPPAPPLPRTFKDKPASPNKPKPKKGPAGPPAVSKVKQDAEDAKNKSREEATAAYVEKSKRDKQPRPVVKRPSSSLTAGDDAFLNRSRRIAAGQGLGEGYPVDVAYDIDPAIREDVDAGGGGGLNIADAAADPSMLERRNLPRLRRLISAEQESGGERNPQSPGGPVGEQGGVMPSGRGGDPNVPTEIHPGLRRQGLGAVAAEGDAFFPEERSIAGSNPEELQARIDEQLLRRAREEAAAKEDVNYPPGGGFGRPGTDTGPVGPPTPSGTEDDRGSREPPIASLSPEELDARVSGALEDKARRENFPDFDPQQAQQAVESGAGEPAFDPATGELVADTSPGAGGGTEGGPEFVGPQDQQPGSPWYKNPWVIGGAGAAAGAAGLYMVLKALKKRKRRRDEDEEEGRGGRRKAAGSYPGAHRKNKGRKKKRVKIGPKGKAYVDDDKDDEKRAHIRRTVISNATARFLHG